MPIPNDTHPEAERVQIELLREAGMEGRLQLAFSLTDSVLSLSEEGLRRRNPGLTEQEIRLRGLAIRYGEDIAVAVRAKLAAKESSKTD